MKDEGLLQFPHPFFSERPAWKMKDHAFMRGFMIVIGVFLVINLVASLLSVIKQGGELDAEAIAAAKEFTGGI